LVGAFGDREINVASVVPSVLAIVQDDLRRVLLIRKTAGTYINPGQVLAYHDGEVRQQFSVAFRARFSAASREHATRAARSRG
jgi:hypothetical protein